ncbi:MAG: septation regulator SpoVG [Deltaproteobacteria bacterium]|nr:septation regulator SpoVG [Deltaproteobacteria bacterium]
MEITEVKVFPVNEDKLKAYVTIIFENCFVIRDLKIINGNSGLFVAMPSKKRKDGTFRDIAHPLNSEMRSTLEKKVLAVYEEELKKMTAAAQKSMQALSGQKRGTDDYDDGIH